MGKSLNQLKADKISIEIEMLKARREELLNTQALDAVFGINVKDRAVRLFHEKSYQSSHGDKSIEESAFIELIDELINE